jgi:hypothetical protein
VARVSLKSAVATVESGEVPDPGALVHLTDPEALARAEAVLRGAAEDVLSGDEGEGEGGLSPVTNRQAIKALKMTAQEMLERAASQMGMSHLNSSDADSESSSVGTQENEREAQRRGFDHRSRLRARSAAAWDKLFGLSVGGTPRRASAGSGAATPRSARSAPGSSRRGEARSRSRSQQSQHSLAHTFGGDARPYTPRRSAAQVDAHRRFDRDDDARNCTFAPRVLKSSKAMVRSSGPFMQRFESAEEAHRSALETRRLKKEYEARVDKKMCPKCGVSQSFDELRQHKNACQRCKAPYRHRLVWGEVGPRFLKRVEDKRIEREEKLAEVESKVTPPFALPEKRVYDPELDVVRKVHVPQREWSQVRENFLRRTEDDLRLREAKRLLAERDSALLADCTFQPRLTSREPRSAQPGWASLGGGESFDERMERDKHRRRREEAQRQLRAKLGLAYAQGPQLVSLKGKPAPWDEVQRFSGGQHRNPTAKWTI